MLERFNILEFVSEGPVFRARVHYWHETGFETNEELKAYSVAVVDSIKELVNLNPLYKEGLSLILDRLDVHDPGVLADFAAAMTTASGEELQEILASAPYRACVPEGLAVAVWAAVASALSLPGRGVAPFLAQRFGATRVQALVTLLLAAATVLMVSGRTGWEMAGHFAVFGLAFGAVLPLRAMAMAGWYSGPEYGRTMGV